MTEGDFAFRYEVGWDIASNFDFNQYPQTRIAYLELIDGTYRTVRVIDHNRFASEPPVEGGNTTYETEVKWQMPENI